MPRRSARTDDVEVRSFDWRGHELVYESIGTGPRTFVFVHGLMLTADLNRPLARRIAERGHRVILPELLGHGRSDKPRHAYQHRLEFEADQLVGLLDHLGVDDAVIGGTSLGANVTLQLAAQAPERVRAMVVEMPVLERGGVAAMAAFFPLLLALRYGGPLPHLVTGLARRLPRTGIEPVDSFHDLISRHPRELAAVIHGLMSGPLCPPEHERRAMHAPTLVIAHRGDLLHPMSDADALAQELPNAVLARAWSFIEARTFPKRISNVIADFLDAVWAPREVRTGT